MTLSHQLAQLRPLMTRADMDAILGPEQRNRALDQFNGFTRETGVEIWFSHCDEVIDRICFSLPYCSFPRDIAVCGVSIGMAAEALPRALPEVRFADGGTGQPNERGFVIYEAQLTSPDIEVGIAAEDGEVVSITLQRSDLSEVNARRELREAKRRADQDRKRELANGWRSIQDPDAMLFAWAEHCEPWTHTTPAPFVAFARWLIATRDPDIWHVVASHWNWDYGHAPLLWIIRQKDCDLATALKVFFLAEPSYYFRWGDDRTSVPESNREMFDFLTEMHRRFVAGFYTRSEIAYDGAAYRKFVGDARLSIQDKSLAERFYPRQAEHTIPGRDPTRGNSDAVAECDAYLAPLN